MSRLSRVELSRGAPPLLPRELWVVYLVAPFVATLLLVDGFWSMSAAVELRKAAAVAIPFVALTVVFDVLYRFVVPGVVRHVERPAAQVAVHAVLVALVACVVGTALLPLHNWVCGLDVPLLQFVINCVLISYVMLVPALLVQRQRNRVVAMEQQMVAERQAALRAQLDALQARTNPHFFFNSINTVAALITEDPVLAERTLERLAELFRYALNSSTTERVPLSREFEVVRDFLEIHRARFGERLKMRLELAPEAADFLVPPLLLQPLVENAVVHGLGERRAGLIEVVAWRSGATVVIEVRDDGPGPGKSLHQGTQTSVRELRARLGLIFGNAAAFTLEPGPAGGCLARVAVST